MNEDKGIMKYETTLPEDFNGVFTFTNSSDEDFVGVWGSKEYHFPAQRTSPMIMPEYSPLEIQNIRKKFAKDYGEREYYKSQQYGSLARQEKNDDGSPKLNSIHMAGTYSIDVLTPYIQSCLEPLPIAKAVVQDVPKETVEDKLSRNPKGRRNTAAVGLGDEEGLELLARGVE